MRRRGALVVGIAPALQRRRLLGAVVLDALGAGGRVARRLGERQRLLRELDHDVAGDVSRRPESRGGVGGAFGGAGDRFTLDLGRRHAAAGVGRERRRRAARARGARMAGGRVEVHRSEQSKAGAPGLARKPPEPWEIARRSAPAAANAARPRVRLSRGAIRWRSPRDVAPIRPSSRSARLWSGRGRTARRSAARRPRA